MNYGGEEIEVTNPFICPLCEVHELDPYDRESTLCPTVAPLVECSWSASIR
jgi:hypothetical protein